MTEQSIIQIIPETEQIERTKESLKQISPELPIIPSFEGAINKSEVDEYLRWRLTTRVTEVEGVRSPANPFMFDRPQVGQTTLTQSTYTINMIEEENLHLLDNVSLVEDSEVLDPSTIFLVNEITDLTVTPSDKMFLEVSHEYCVTINNTLPTDYNRDLVSALNRGQEVRLLGEYTDKAGREWKMVVDRLSNVGWIPTESITSKVKLFESKGLALDDTSTGYIAGRLLDKDGKEINDQNHLSSKDGFVVGDEVLFYEKEGEVLIINPTGEDIIIDQLLIQKGIRDINNQEDINLLTQTLLKSIGFPYAWGGGPRITATERMAEDDTAGYLIKEISYGSFDCSRLFRILATVGIKLPNNSTLIGHIGEEMDVPLKDGIIDYDKFIEIDWENGLTALVSDWHIAFPLKINDQGFLLHALYMNPNMDGENMSLKNGQSPEDIHKVVLTPLTDIRRNYPKGDISKDPEVNISGVDNVVPYPFTKAVRFNMRSKNI